MRAHAGDDLRLCPGDVLSAAEKPDAHVGDAGEGGLARGSHALDLMRVVHAELADEHLRVLGGREERERQADQVVVVAGGGVGAAL